MRKLLFSVALLSSALWCSAETKQALTLYMEEGAEIVYFLDTEPLITFEGQTLVVTVDNEPTDIPMQDVNHWEIGMVDTGINQTIPQESPKIAIYGNLVTVCNPALGEIVVYTLAGVQVAGSAQAEASFTLPQGIYIITIADNSYKISIR